MKDLGAIKIIITTKVVSNGLRAVGMLIQHSWFKSRFGYDNNTKKFTASVEVWDAYIEAHPKDAYLRTGSFSDFEDLGLAVENGVAVGRNAIGLGSATDARTIGVDESRGPHIEELNYDADNEAFVVLGQDDPPLSGSKSPLAFTEVPVESTQRRAPAKRSRGQFETNSGHTEIVRIRSSWQKLKKSLAQWIELKASS
ncbi:uncharacterized protein LOC131019984 [Salvia miltiorrhiza]|uniref:uncharacterized protein LOC131019984 n=1 Tax=Salvia miltiorrhiza TaxID=226208 RepID=UPI0025AC16C8|nr:uncharacterized protein LOC131019984 [Salvia miltiorrhiza]